MNSTRYYLTLFGWLLIGAGICVWVWLQVRKTDRKQEAEEARQIEVDAEYDEWRDAIARKSFVNRPPKEDKSTKLGFRDDAFALDDDEQPHPPGRAA